MIFYFEDLLKTNGICIPRTPIRKLVFEHRWAEAEEIYSQKMRKRSNAQARWDDRREEIKKDWGVDIEYPSFETPRFTTPQEAVAEISKIPAPSSRDLFDTVVDNERSNWLKQIIADAPDTSTYNDTATELRQMLSETDDESVKIGLTRMLEYIQGHNYEKPITDDCIPVGVSV